jgi:lysophospholipase L1-like esterase
MGIRRPALLIAGVALSTLTVFQAFPGNALAQTPGGRCGAETASKPHACSASGSFSGKLPASLSTTATTLIFGSGDYGSTESITDLQTLLDDDGWPTDVATSLPTNLSQYKAIWFVDTQNPLTAGEEKRLENFVRVGKGLYLTGERPCCETLNQSDQAVIDSLVSGGGVQVGGLGDADFANTFEPANLGAVAGLMQHPNFISEWNPDAPGGLAGISGANVTTTAPGGVPTGAAWDQSSMANGKGRLAIQMDVNWLEWSDTAEQANTLLAQNIESFLMKQRAPAPTGSQYAALGDSYASGEGSFSYLKGTASSSDKCHRATDGYAEQLASQFTLPLGFPACSGDIITDLYQSNSATAQLFTSPSAGYAREKAQFSTLGPDTQLVTLSIGGNDVGFARVLHDCISGALSDGSYGCQSRDQTSADDNLSYLVNGRPDGCMAFFPFADPGNDTDGFCAAEPSLEQVYTDITELAPNAAIYVIGYPHLFGTTFNKKGVCDVGGVLGARETIQGSDVEWINSETDNLDQDIQAAVNDAAAATGHSITFVDPSSTFAGHGVCDSGTPWINGLKLRFSTNAVEAESFHPNVTGQQMLTNLISQTILNVGQY